MQQFVAKNVAKDHWEGLIDRLGAAVATAETSIVTGPIKTISAAVTSTVTRPAAAGHHSGSGQPGENTLRAVWASNLAY